MYVNVAKELISTMQGYQTILVLNVCPVFQRQLISTIASVLKQYQYSMYVSVSKGTHQYNARLQNKYQYSMYVSVPKALISNMLGFSNIIITQCMVNVAKELISTMQGYQTILVLNVCQLFQRHSFSTMQVFLKQYQYSMYVSVPKGTHLVQCKASNNISTQCMAVFQRH